MIFNGRITLRRSWRPPPPFERSRPSRPTFRCQPRPFDVGFYFLSLLESYYTFTVFSNPIVRPVDPPPTKHFCRRLRRWRWKVVFHSTSSSDQLGQRLVNLNSFVCFLLDWFQTLTNCNVGLFLWHFHPESWRLSVSSFCYFLSSFVLFGLFFFFYASSTWMKTLGRKSCLASCESQWSAGCPMSSDRLQTAEWLFQLRNRAVFSNVMVISMMMGAAQVRVCPLWPSVRTLEMNHCRN